MRPFLMKKTFHQPVLVNDQKNKKWSLLFPTFLLQTYLNQRKVLFKKKYKH